MADDLPPAPLTPREARKAANRLAWANRNNPDWVPPEPPPEPPVELPPPAPDDPLKTHAELEIEARRLYQRSLKTLQTIIDSPHSTNQDRIQAAQHLRLSASIGQSEPAPTVYILPMASLLGADAPDQPAPPKEEA